MGERGGRRHWAHLGIEEKVQIGDTADDNVGVEQRDDGGKEVVGDSGCGSEGRIATLSKNLMMNLRGEVRVGERTSLPALIGAPSTSSVNLYLPL